MRDAIPIENLLLLLCANAVVLVKEIKERALGFFEGGIGAGLEVAQIGEDTFFELLCILDRTAEGLEAESQTAHNVRASYVEKVAPG